MQQQHRLLLFLTFPICTLCLSAQKQTMVDCFPVLFNDAERQEVRRVIRNKQGEYVVVGTTTHWLWGDNNMFLSMVGNKSVGLNKSIGGKGNEQAFGVVQTRDGGYVLAGFTESVAKRDKGKREAWLVKVDENGLPLWDKVVSTPNDDVFNDIVENPKNGDLWMTGESGGRLWVVRVNAKGENPLLKSFVSNAALSSFGRGLAWTRNGRDVMVVGQQVMRYPQGKGQKNLLLLPFDTEGEDFRTENELEHAEGNSIVRDRHGNFAIAGTSYVHKDYDKGDILFAYADSDGRILAHSMDKNDEKRALGLKFKHDEGWGVAEDLDGNFTVVGARCPSPSDKTNNPWWAKFSPDGNLLGAPQMEKSSGNDVFLGTVFSETGELAMVGKRYNNLKTDGWLLICPPSVKSKNPDPVRGLVLTKGRFRDDEDSSILRKDTRGFYDFWLENPTNQSIYGLTAKVTQVRGRGANLQAHGYNYLHIGALHPKERKLVTVPIASDLSLKRDEWDFQIKIAAQKDTLDDLTHTFHVSTRPILQYLIETTNTLPSDIRAGSRVTFSFTVKNIGDLAAKNMVVNFDPPIEKRIKVVGDKTQKFSTLNTGDSVKTIWEFEVDPLFADKSVVFPMYVSVEGKKPGIEFLLRSYIKPEEKRPLSIFWQDGRKQQTVGIPNPVFTLTVETDRKLDTVNWDKHATISVNNRVRMGEKFDNVRLSEVKNAGLHKFRYVLIFKPPLRIGTSEIIVEFNDGVEKMTERLTVQRVEPPNLYVLAVGVDYQKARKLQYTKNDADKFGEVFNQQSDKLYKTITVKTLTSKEDTKAKAIKFNLELYASECKEGDVLMVLLSGHGSIPEYKSDSIWFWGSEFDPKNPRREHYLEYNEDIKTVLEKTKGKKILFLDACQGKEDRSGLPDRTELSDAIARVVTAANSFRALLSCSKGQSSWESATYKQGMFTQALLEAFRNQKVLCNEEDDCTANTADSKFEKPDRILTFQELSQFAKKRVPYMAKQEKGEKQEPTDNDKNPNEDLPIFWFDN
jgi:hypothetical protein